MRRDKRSPPASSGGSPSPDAPAMFRTVTRWLKGIAVLILASWALLGLHMLPRNNAGTGGSGAGPDSHAGTPPVRSVRRSAGKGPWGRLTYSSITISPPLELIHCATPLTAEEVTWHFPNMIPERLAALLSEIGLSEPVREKLVSLADVNPQIKGVTVRPTREIVLGLSPEDRSVLYTALNEYRENLDHRNSFRFCGTSLDEWIGDSELSRETIKTIEPLVYRHKSFLFFTDLRTIEGSLPSPEERSLLIEALSHQSTFLVRLELSEESDLEELVGYWGRGGRAKDVRPILESLREADGEQCIDIAYLLPPFARSRLYTYHVFSDDDIRYRRDCHWTALNFFSEQPDDRFADVKEVSRTLQEDYYRIYGGLRLGDVVAFFDPRHLIHTAVFIADDFLFTKNGRSSSEPWILMKLEDMKYYYPTRKELEIRYYRSKDL